MKNKIIRKLFLLLLLALLLSQLLKTQFSVLAFTDGQCEFTPSYANSPPLLDDATFTATGFRVYQERAGEKCYFPGSCIQGDLPINVVIEGLSFHNPNNKYNNPTKVDFILQKIRDNNTVERAWPQTANIVNNTATVSQNFGEGGKYIAQVSYLNSIVGVGILACQIKRSMPFIAEPSCDPNSCSTTPTDTSATGNSYELCSMQIGQNQTTAFNHCVECMNKQGVWTAIGCIPQTTEGVVKTLIEIGLVISGAVVLVMIFAGAFMLSTSQGDPKKTQDAKELITSAIIGLLFVIFSVTILQFIGVSVLRIPGFGQP